MNHIQKLQWQKTTLLEFYNAFLQLEAAQKKMENTGYKGDALNAIKASYVRLNTARKDIEEKIITSTKPEEVKNVGR